jgi:hypothetical protein
VKRDKETKKERKGAKKGERERKEVEQAANKGFTPVSCS